MWNTELEAEREERVHAHFLATPGAVQVFGGFIESSFFRDEWRKDQFTALKDLVAKFNRLPTPEEFISHYVEHSENFNRQADLVKQQELERLKATYEIDTTLVTRAEIGEWVIRQQINSLPTEALGTKDLSEFVAKTQRFLQRTMPLLSGAGSESVFPFEPEYRREQIRAVIDKTLANPIPTGFPRIDELIQYGGLLRGELGLVIAQMGGWKTGFLVNLAVNMLYQGKRVLYVTLEGGAKLIQDRLYYLTSGIPSNMETTLEALDDGVAFAVPGDMWKNFVLAPLPSNRITAAGLQAVIQTEAARAGAPFDVVLVDHADLLRPEHRYEKKYEHLGDLSYELVNIAGWEKVVIWTASQGNREGMKAGKMRAFHISDGINKTNAPSFVGSLTQDELDIQASPQRIWLAIDKNRRGRGNVDVPLFVNPLLYRIWSDMESPLKHLTKGATKAKRDEPEDGGEYKKKIKPTEIGGDGFHRKSDGKKYAFRG